MRPLAATPKKSSCRRQAATAGRGVEAPAEGPAACEVAGGSGAAAAWGAGMAIVALLRVCAVGYSMLGCRAGAKEDGSFPSAWSKLAPRQAGELGRSNALQMAGAKRTDRAYCMRQHEKGITWGPQGPTASCVNGWCLHKGLRQLEQNRPGHALGVTHQDNTSRSMYQCGPS